MSLDRNYQEVLNLLFVSPGLHFTVLKTEKILQFWGKYSPRAWHVVKRIHDDSNEWISALRIWNNRESGNEASYNRPAWILVLFRVESISISLSGRLSATNFPRACHLQENANPISDYSHISIESSFYFSLSLSLTSVLKNQLHRYFYIWPYVTTDKEHKNKAQEEKTRKMHSWNTNNDDDALKKKKEKKKKLHSDWLVQGTQRGIRCG